MPAASIHLEQFGGARPRRDSRVLADYEAQLAENCRLTSGKLGAWRKPLNTFPVGQNYLQWSNQFQQAIWAQAGLIDVLANATLAPDGSLTADKLREDVTSATHRVQQSIAKSAVAEFWTGACSAKPAERNFMWLRIESVVDFAQCIVNVNTGVVFSLITSGGFSSASTYIVDEANGFRRVHLTAKTPATAGLTLYVGVCADGANLTYAGVLNSGIYVDGASLRKSDKPGPYRETLASSLPADPTSIYGFMNSWFVANEVRHFARGPLPLDPLETTYFTRASGDPRVTYSPIAEDTTGSGDLPRNSFSMGLPVPTNPPVAVQSPVGGTITAASAILGTIAGPIITQTYQLGPFATDGSTVAVRMNLHASLQTLNCNKATAVVSLRRTDFAGILQKYEVPVEFDLEPVIGDTVVVDRTIEFEDAAPAGSHTWEATIVVTPYSGTITPTYAHTGGSVRYTKTLISALAHGRAVGDLVAITNVVGMEAINLAQVAIIGVPNVNSFYIDADSQGQIYVSGGTWALSVDDENTSDTAYVFTWLSTIGGKVLEGPPSAPSNIINRGDGQTINLSGIDIIPPADGGSYLFSGKRIYRTNVRSDLGANYQFVAEIAVAANNYVDTVRSVALGETMPSTTWIKPPNDMHGLVEMTDGVLAGISGKQICFSEPYQPHAWPVAYRLNTYDDAVGLVPFGSSIAVLTLGKPHVINGTTPGSMTMAKIEAAQPCMSALSIVDMGSSGIYAGDDGLVMISTAGVELVTREILTKEEWKALDPTSMRAAEYDDRYVCSFIRLDGTKGSFVLDPHDPIATYTTLDVYFSALWTSPKNGNMFVLFDEYIAEFNAATNDWFDYRWRSKTFNTHDALNFAFAKVEASDYPINLDIYSNPDPAYIERAEGVSVLELMDSLTITDANPFTLRGDYSGNLYEFELRGNGAGVVKRLSVATGIELLNGG